MTDLGSGATRVTLLQACVLIEALIHEPHRSAPETGTAKFRLPVHALILLRR